MGEISVFAGLIEREKFARLHSSILDRVPFPTFSFKLAAYFLFILFVSRIEVDLSLEWANLNDRDLNGALLSIKDPFHLDHRWRIPNGTLAKQIIELRMICEK